MCSSCVNEIRSYLRCNSACQSLCFPHQCCSISPHTPLFKKRSRLGKIFQDQAPALEDLIFYKKKLKREALKKGNKGGKGGKGVKGGKVVKGEKGAKGEKGGKGEKEGNGEEDGKRGKGSKGGEGGKGGKGESEGHYDEYGEGGKYGTNKEMGGEGDTFGYGINKQKWKEDNECRPNQLIKCPQPCTLKPKKCMPNQIGPCNEACLKGIPYEPQGKTCTAQQTTPCIQTCTGNSQPVAAGVQADTRADMYLTRMQRAYAGIQPNINNSQAYNQIQQQYSFLALQTYSQQCAQYNASLQKLYCRPGGIQTFSVSQNMACSPKINEPTSPPFYRGELKSPNITTQIVCGSLQASTAPPQIFSNYMQNNDSKQYEKFLASCSAHQSVKCKTCGRYKSRQTPFLNYPNKR